LQVAYFKSAKMHKVVKAALIKENPQAIHIQNLRMGQYIPKKYFNKSIMDLPDAASLYFKRRYQSEKHKIKKEIFHLEYQRLLEYENKYQKQYYKVLCCSEEDMEYLKKNLPTNNYGLLKNGVDTNKFKPLKNSSKKPELCILFTGNMNYAPNIDAVLHFANDIFPEIKEKYPEAIFRIAGQKPTKKVLRLRELKGVQITGFIPNFRDAYSTATVVVAPLRFGAGTQNKVLEALCMDIPVVCTHIGFLGLGIKNGQGIYCETTTEGFIRRLLQIIEHPNESLELASKTGAIIRNKYSWTAIAKKLEGYFKEVAEKN